MREMCDWLEMHGNKKTQQIENEESVSMITIVIIISMMKSRSIPASKTPKTIITSKTNSPGIRVTLYLPPYLVGSERGTAVAKVLFAGVATERSAKV